MPIYEYVCLECDILIEELRALGDFTFPKCSICGKVMERAFSPVTAILKGAGWINGEQEKLRKRSEDQGMKFFKRHPDKQEMVKETLAKKQKEA